jgi:hypothetical protein
LTCTLPKATPVGLRLSVGTAAFSFRAKLFVTLPELAVKATAWGVPTDEIVAVKPALVALAGTVTLAGTATAALLLDKLTVSPPLGAAAVNVTVQASVPDPVMDPLLQESVLNADSAAWELVAPVPLRLMTAAPLGNALLAMVSRPVVSPEATGLNCTLKL